MPSLLTDSIGVLTGVSGLSYPRRVTLESLVANLPTAAVSCALNAGGGFLARGISRSLSDKHKDWSEATVTFFLALIAVSLKAGFQDITNPREAAIREVASGLAGWVGDDVLDWIWQALTIKDWRSGKSYKTGDKVKYLGKLWEASSDLPFDPPKSPLAEPSKDSRWKAHRAQGLNFDDMRLYAQAFVSDPTRVRNIAADVATLIADRGVLADEHKPEFVSHCQQVLGDVITQLSEYCP